MAPQQARVHLLISGRVQGVGFRESTRMLAERVGLTGWVRNLPDGRVEVELEGPPDDLDRAVAWCRQGPPGARVAGVEVRALEPRAEDGFRVLPTSPRWAAG